MRGVGELAELTGHQEHRLLADVHRVVADPLDAARDPASPAARPPGPSRCCRRRSPCARAPCSPRRSARRGRSASLRARRRGSANESIATRSICSARDPISTNASDQLRPESPPAPKSLVSFAMFTHWSAIRSRWRLMWRMASASRRSPGHWRLCGDQLPSTPRSIAMKWPVHFVVECDDRSSADAPS